MRISDWSSDVCSSDLRRGAGGVDGKVDGEGRALAGHRIGEDVPARLLDDAVDGREPQPGALAGFLGGEEGLENLAEMFGRDARAGIAHLECGIIGDRQDVARHLADRSEEHTSELQSLMRISYAVFCLKTKTIQTY